MKLSLTFLYNKYKKQIICTFIFLSFEAILLALIPYGIGLAIDSLVNKTFFGLYFLLLIFFLILIISSLRRFYDTRVYSRIYTLISISLIKENKKNNVSDASTFARSTLIKELVDFFEHDLVQAYSSIIGLLTSLVMIFYLNLAVFFLASFSIIILIIIYKLSEKNIYIENSKLNQNLENRLDIIKNKNIFLIKHFRKIETSMIKLSDIEVKNYIFIQMFIAILVINSLFLSINLSSGQIFSLLTYVLNFSFEILSLPLVFGQFIRLKEITNRINIKEKNDNTK